MLDIEKQAAQQHILERLNQRDRATASQSEIDALRERIGVLEKALEPFAEAATKGEIGGYPPNYFVGATEFENARRARTAENERLKTMLTGGNLEIVESEQAWKLRAESSEALVAELREKVERLRKALEPFAKAASDYERQGEFFSDNVELVLRVSVFAAPEYHNSTAVQVGDLRRARTALEGRDNG